MIPNVAVRGSLYSYSYRVPEIDLNRILVLIYCCGCAKSGFCVCLPASSVAVMLSSGSGGHAQTAQENNACRQLPTNLETARPFAYIPRDKILSLSVGPDTTEWQTSVKGAEITLNPKSEPSPGAPPEIWRSMGLFCLFPNCPITSSIL